ncbi:MAG: sulfatase-like hydrolase/transferase [Iamia sp.]
MTPIDEPAAPEDEDLDHPPPARTPADDDGRSGPPDGPGDGDDPGRPWAGRLLRLVELVALCGFAITQPVLDTFGASPEEFVFRGASRPVVVLFGLGVALGPALVLWAAEIAVDLVHRPAGRVVHVAFLAVLAAAVAVRVVKSVGLQGPLLALLAVALAAGATALWLRADPVRQFLRFSAIPVVAFLVMFMVFSPTARLLRSEGTASGARIGNPKRVVMLVLDELPLASLIGADGEIDRDLYPGFARLAETTSWYRNATSVASSTGFAVPALAAGALPEDRLPIAQDYPDSLFTLLGGSYEMQVTESITRLCPTSLCDPPEVPARQSLRDLTGDAADVLRSQLSLGDDDTAAVAGFVDDAPRDEDVFDDFGVDQPERFAALLDSLADSPEQTLHYLHILLPHQPWRYLPSGVRYDQEPGNPGEAEDRWADDPWPAQLGQERHLLQARYVDGLVGALLDRMEETGTLDDSLLVVAADHGIAFQPGQPIRGLEQDTFDEAVYPELMWVPLFIKRPGQAEGATLDTNVETIDVLPTIADVLDIDLPFEVDGRPVDDEDRGTDKVFFQNRFNGFGVSPGIEETVDADEGWELLLDRTVDSVLPPDGPLRSWRVGPRPELIGQPVSELVVGPASDAQITLDEGGDQTEVDLAGPLPALLRGRIEGVRTSPTTLLYALNGAVAAVAPTFAANGTSAEVAALLPEDLYVAGDNRLDVYLLGDGDALLPVAQG